jgi:hypothetical protein
MPTLVVQMGHVGRSTGATGAPGEQAYTAAVGASCARLLDGRGGWAVRLIVADPPLAQYRGDAFVAVHADGSTNPAVRGASVGYQNLDGGQLAGAWRLAYTELGFTGPWHPANYTTNLAGYYGVRNAVNQGNRRACIIECGTITNADDRAIMQPDRVAAAIGRALNIPTEGAMATVNVEETDQSYIDLVHNVGRLHDLIMPHFEALVGRVQSIHGDFEETEFPATFNEANGLTKRLNEIESMLDELISRPAQTVDGPSAADVAAEILKQLGGQS